MNLEIVVVKILNRMNVSLTMRYKVLYKDKTGKSIKITKGTRFLAKDRLGRVFEYVDTGGHYYYEKTLRNLTDNTETRVTKNWFLERYVEILRVGDTE